MKNISIIFYFLLPVIYSCNLNHTEIKLGTIKEDIKEFKTKNLDLDTTEIEYLNDLLLLSLDYSEFVANFGDILHKQDFFVNSSEFEVIRNEYFKYLEDNNINYNDFIETIRDVENFKKTPPSTKMKVLNTKIDSACLMEQKRIESIEDSILNNGSLVIMKNVHNSFEFNLKPVQKFRKLETQIENKTGKVIKEINYRINIQDKNNQLIKYIESRAENIKLEEKSFLIDIFSEEIDKEVFEILHNPKNLGLIYAECSKIKIADNLDYKSSKTASDDCSYLNSDNKLIIQLNEERNIRTQDLKALSPIIDKHHSAFKKIFRLEEGINL